MLVTDRRLVTYRAPLRKLGAPRSLGAVPLSEVAGARLPYVGGGWRVVELHLRSGLRVRFLADRDHAEAFVSSLLDEVDRRSNGPKWPILNVPWSLVWRRPRSEPGTGPSRPSGITPVMSIPTAW